MTNNYIATQNWDSESIIFYSWQSDLNSKTNRFFIRDIIKDVIKKINRNVDLEVRFDHDTKGISGTPDIVEEIFTKIKNSTIFICDISIINSSSKFRKTPNPNVLLELGYAVSQLGWNKIICLFNSKFGKLENLPFDLRNRRHFSYYYDGSKENKSKAKNQLKIGLETAILSILDKEFTESNNSISEEKIRNRFAAVMFLERNPLSLANYKYHLNYARLMPMIMTNNIIEQLQKNNPKFINLDLLVKEEGWKPIDDLFQRYIFDLLAYRYRAHWYVESIEVKNSSHLTGRHGPIDYKLQTKKIPWNDLNEIFLNNEFIKIGNFSNQGDEYVPMNVNIAVPPNTSIKTSTIINGFQILFENEFIKLSIKSEHSLPDKKMSKDIQKAYRMNRKTKDNFSYQSFIFTTEITKKKLRSNHSDMPKYEYWANDLINYLEKNISVSEFWRVIKLNQKWFY